MEVSIRSFRNTDLPALCQIWNAHHASLGMHHTLQVDQMELFVQSKVYFDSEQLLLGSLDDQLVGFIHLCPMPNEAFDVPLPGRLGIAALCVLPGEVEDAVAGALLQAAERMCRTLGTRQVSFRPALPFCSFYLGLGPADSLAGTLSIEEKVCRWLSSSGYKPAVPTTYWELDLQRFRVPGDRIQILVRRRSVVDRQLQEPLLPWWQSCVLGHAEVTAFHLFDRVEKRALQEVILWSLAPSLSGRLERVAWLWPPKMEYSPEDAPIEIAPVDRLVFLLAETLRDLQSERVETVRTTTLAEANDMHRVLHRLGFSAMESGIVFELPMTNA